MQLWLNNNTSYQKESKLLKVKMKLVEWKEMNKLIQKILDIYQIKK